MSLLNKIYRISKHTALISAPVALLLSADPAKAILNIAIFDDGPNLKVEVSGSLSELGSSIANVKCGVEGALFSRIICTGIDTLSRLTLSVGLQILADQPLFFRQALSRDHFLPLAHLIQCL
jgi:hypothetical protein